MEKRTLSQQLIGTNKMPIMGWCSVPEKMSTERTFQYIHDCGINVFMTVGAGGGATGPTGDSSAIMTQLELAKQLDLKAIVCDKRFHPSNKKNWKTAVDSALKDYADHPAVCGYYVFDEPVFNDQTGRPGLQEVAPMIEYLIQQSPDKVAYVNGLGFGSRGTSSFEDYIDNYTSIINPQFISTDCYPLTTIPDDDIWPGYAEDDAGLIVPEFDAYYRAAYWESWETQLQTARRYQKPLWGFVMAVPHTHSRWFYGPVTEGTIRLEAFTALAYGAEVIQYFSLVTPEDNGYYDHAILDPDGEPSVRYPLFKKVNRDVGILGNIMTKLRVKSVYYQGWIPSGGKEFRKGRYAGDSSHRPLASVTGSGNILLSFMDSPTRETYLFILNNNPAKRGRFMIQLENDYVAREVIVHHGNLAAPQGPLFISNHEPGHGRLYLVTKRSA